MAGPGAHEPALPFGPLDPAGHRTLELGLRAWVREQTGPRARLRRAALHVRRPPPRPARAGGRAAHGLDRLPGPRARGPGGRGGAGALAGLLRVPALGGRPRGAAGAPREGDRPRARALGGGGEGRRDAAGPSREGRHHVRPARGGLRPRARCWSATSCSTRRGSSARPGATGRRPPGAPVPPLGEPMALDHRRLLATALGRLRGKLKYRPVVFELLPATFTLLRLQRVVEALAGAPAPQAELPAPRREGRPRGGHGRRRAGDRGPAGGALPLPPRGAPRAAGAGSGPAPGPVRRLSVHAGLDFYAPT